MDEIETKPVKVIRLGKLEIEPYIGFWRGCGLGLSIGDGFYNSSIQLEFTLLCVNLLVSFVWDNPIPTGESW